MQFETSDFDDKPVDSGELYIKITGIIKDILSRKFLAGPKTKIDHTTKSLNFACPYCGDSQKDEDKKRGHMYHNDGSFFFKCYNDGCGHKTPLSQFLEDFNSKEDLSPGEFRYLKNSFDSDKVGGVGGIAKSSSKPHSSLLFKAVKEHGIDRATLIKHMFLTPAADSFACRQYLVDVRKQPVEKLKFFAYNSYNKNIYILNLDEETDKVFGMQIRYDKPVKGKRFHTYPYTEIVSMIMKQEVDLSPETKLHLNKLSLAYNITNIRFNFPIFIFESAIDSNHFDNSIAAMGTNNKILIPNAYHIYDNDKGGKNEAIKDLKDGKRVFLWEKFLKDNQHIDGVKDFNDVFKKGYRYTQAEVIKYCSDDQIDMFYI